MNRQISKDAQFNENCNPNKGSYRPQSHWLEVGNKSAQSNCNKDYVKIGDQLIGCGKYFIRKFRASKFNDNGKRQDAGQNSKVEFCFKEDGFELIVYVAIFFVFLLKMRCH